MEKVNNIFQTVQEMRKKCLFTLTLLKTYYEKSSDTKWSVFQKAHIDDKLVVDENTLKILESTESVFVDGNIKK